tara:strand:- start:3077 stop:5017 length:1941 start_codon:yes stop_codon:yes gene_type:complete
MINSSENSNNAPELNELTIGEFESNICEFSFFEFWVENINNDYIIQTDNPSSIKCFSKVNGASIINDKKIVYIGSNLNIDLLIQSMFWLVLFSFIPKDKNIKSSPFKYKNISIFIIIFLLFIHFISEESFYSLNSKKFSTDINENFQLYSLILSLFIFLKLFSDIFEKRCKNSIYFLPFIFLIHGTFNSSNLNIYLISFIFIGLSALFINNKYKVVFVIYLILTFIWINFKEVNLPYFDVDKLKGFSSSSYNEYSIFFWSISFFLVVIGMLYYFKFSLNDLNIYKLRFRFLLSGSLIVFFSILSALNPVINFFTYYYFGLNKTASKTFSSVAGNAWRGISSSAEAVGEFFAFVILFTIIHSLYEKNYKYKSFEIFLILVNIYGLYRSNNFSALISMIVLIALATVYLKVFNKKIKYSLAIISIFIFPIIYFSFFNVHNTEESSKKLMIEAFEISNIEYLQTNEFGLTPIDENRFYEIILNSDSKEKISTSLNFLVEEYHFSKRNFIPNITTLISSVATPINRSEKWGIFFAKYNPSSQTLFFGTGPINLTNYYLSHETKANTGLILPHSSIFSYLVFIGAGGLSIILISIFNNLIRNRKNVFFIVISSFFLINILKSDSLLYFSSFALFIFALNTSQLFKVEQKYE